ncbi:MFS transporter [Saccharibacillus kuerlensis]|uniref:Major facilitator superfamily (MFS) profile domain-containing protein n=1 Tax=Saccharibacillus kuerlensis TaxID=459527 RepID=A0ABQ2L114_9BACL|nr:MFS transporter [Saccharibacillus kuerlensis]GGN99190.1 hypothetical protein GCM10010969_19120 [Saccharibacillus kuerlensis]
MQEYTRKVTPFGRLIVATVLGMGTSVAPLVLLGFGLSTFIIIRIVGQNQATAAYGFASGIIGIAVVIFGIFGGVLADKFQFKIGRRRFWIAAGSVGGALSMLTLTYANNLFTFIAALAAVNFFYFMVTLSCSALVPEQVEESKYGRVSGLMGAAAPALVMIGQMLMGVFAESTLEQKMIAILLIQLLGGFTAFFLIKDNYIPVEQRVKKPKTGIRGFYPSFKEHPSYTWALLTKLFINFSNAGLSMLTLFYIARFHLGEADIFRIMGYTAPTILLMVAAGLLGGYLSDKVRKQKPFVFGAAVVTGACLVTFAFSNNITWVIAGNFIFNFGFGMYNAVDNALVNRILPSKEEAGKYISMMNVTTNLSSSLVNFAAPSLIALGVLLFGGDGYTLFFLVLAAFSVLSAVFVLPIPEMSPGKPEPQEPNASKSTNQEAIV